MIFLFYYIILLSHVFLLKETLLLPEVCLYWYCVKRVHCTHSTWTQPMDALGLCNRWDWVDPTHLSWLLWVGYTHGSPVCLGPSNLRDESAVPTPCLPYVPIDWLQFCSGQHCPCHGLDVPVILGILNLKVVGIMNPPLSYPYPCTHG